MRFQLDIDRQDRVSVSLRSDRSGADLSIAKEQSHVPKMPAPARQITVCFDDRADHLSVLNLAPLLHRVLPQPASLRLDPDAAHGRRLQASGSEEPVSVSAARPAQIPVIVDPGLTAPPDWRWRMRISTHARTAPMTPPSGRQSRKSKEKNHGEFVFCICLGGVPVAGRSLAHARRSAPQPAVSRLGPRSGLAIVSASETPLLCSGWYSRDHCLGIHFLRNRFAGDQVELGQSQTLGLLLYELERPPAWSAELANRLREDGEDHDTGTEADGSKDTRGSGP